MSDFDPAIASHVDGSYADALQSRLATLETMEPTNPRLPGVLGTVALTYERLGEHDTALQYADRALSVPDPVEESKSAFRTRVAERPSTELNVGIVYLRAAARARLAQDDQAAGIHQANARARLRLAGAGIRAQREPGRLHQHAINAASRVAALEVVEGRRLAAMGRSLGALAVAPLSESRIVTHSSNLTPKQQAKSVAKALGRGSAAMGIAALTTPPLPRRLQPKVHTIRDKVILKML